MPAKTKKPAAKPAAARAAATKTSPIAGSLKKGDHVFLVDGSGYIFRAYHALPPLTRKSDGLQINAVLGFCNMLWKLLNDMKPEERPTLWRPRALHWQIWRQELWIWLAWPECGPSAALNQCRRSTL